MADSLKVTADRGTLFRALGHMQSIIEKRVSIPILTNVLIEVCSDGVVQLTGTDLDMQLRETVQVASADGSGTSVSSHKLFEVLRELPEGCQVSLTAEEGRMKVVAGRARFTLPTLPSHDFPLMPEVDFKTQFAVEAAHLRKIIDNARFAVGSEMARPYLQGIFLHAPGSCLRGAATDGLRAAMVTVPLPEGAEGMPDVILPTRCVDELRKLIDERDEPVPMALGRGKVRFDLGNVLLTSKLVEGSYPDYQRVFPFSNDRVLKANPRDLETAIRRVSVLSSDKERKVRLDAANDRLLLATTSTEHGAADEEVLADFGNDTTEIGFNARFLLDNLQLIKGDTAELVMGSASTAAVLIRSPHEPDCAWVLMPMRI